MLYTAVTQEGSDPFVTPRGKGARWREEWLPGTLLQALGDVFTPPQVGGTEAQPLVCGVSPRGGCKWSQMVVDGPSATVKTVSPMLKHFSLGIITFTSLCGFKVKFPL